MKVELRVAPERAEPALVLEVPALTEEAEALADRLRLTLGGALMGYAGEIAVPLELPGVLRFYGADKAVFAQTAAGEFRLRQRLYELEELLDGHVFVRISNSEIVNLKQVTALDLALSGTIKMTLAGGAAVCWVSRRNVKNVKKALGL